MLSARTHRGGAVVERVAGGGSVLGAGGVAAREVLLGRRSESRSDQLDRAGPGRRHVSSHHCVQRLGVSGSFPRSTACERRSSLRRPVVSRKRDGAVKTTREKAEEERQVKLDLAREEVQNGMLVIRQMTDEERRRYPPRTTPPKRPGRRP